MTRFRNSVLARALALALAFSPVAAFAQGFTVPDKSVIQGHVNSTAVAPPVGANCTISAGSTDLFGSCTTSATSGSITFQRTWGTAPNCLLVDTTSAGGAGTIPVYSVSATAITLTTIVNAHILVWSCMGVAPST